MLKKRICGLLLLCVCFNSLNFAVIGNRLRDKLGVTTKENLRNSREFVFGNLAFADLNKSESAQSDDAQTDKTKNTFKVETYTEAYKKAVNDIYDKFEKAYRRNQEIINRSSGLINQTGYQQLLDKQVESEALFKKAFDTAKITKNGDELVFPEFEFDEVKNAVKRLQEQIIEKNNSYVKEKTKLDKKISACVTPYEKLSPNNEHVLEALNEIETM